MWHDANCTLGRPGQYTPHPPVPHPMILKMVRGKRQLDQQSVGSSWSQLCLCKICCLCKIFPFLPYRSCFGMTDTYFGLTVRLQPRSSCAVEGGKERGREGRKNEASIARKDNVPISYPKKKADKRLVDGIARTRIVQGTTHTDNSCK